MFGTYCSVYYAPNKKWVSSSRSFFKKNTRNHSDSAFPDRHYLNGEIALCTEEYSGDFDLIDGDFERIDGDSAREAEEDGDDTFIDRAIHERLWPFRRPGWDELVIASESFCEALPAPLACMATIGRTLSSIEDGRVGAPIITVGGGKTFQTEPANSSPLILQAEDLLAEFQAMHSGTEHLEVCFVGKSAHRQDYDRDVSHWVHRVHEQLIEYFENAPISSSQAAGRTAGTTEAHVIETMPEADDAQVAIGTEQRFVPRPPQTLILKALEGKALKTDALAKVVRDRRSLFNRGPK